MLVRLYDDAAVSGLSPTGTPPLATNGRALWSLTETTAMTTALAQRPTDICLRMALSWFSMQKVRDLKKMLPWKTAD